MLSSHDLNGISTNQPAQSSGQAWRNSGRSRSACHSTGTLGFPKQERMTGTSDHVLYAAIVFLAIHLLPGTPLRGQAVRALGEGAYRGVFSLLSAVVLFWLAVAYANAPHE